MSDASGNSGRQLSQKPAAVYMRRYLAELKAGTRVRTPRKAKDTEANRVVPAEPQSCDSGLPGES